MDTLPTYRLLCLSNGHGEDAIAVRILNALKSHIPSVEIMALPIVGKGRDYTRHNIPIIGTAKTMPSGGFIYMDGKQFVRDIKGGLLQLTLSQIRTVRQWERTGGYILAVGDIVPLLFGWLSGAPYAFVGTAKSEYYIRDEHGLLPRSSWFEKFESWSGSVYVPWERWLMKHSRCKAVFPRDTLTTQILKQWPIPAFDVGNPMMDNLDPHGEAPLIPITQNVQHTQRTILLLPGSRTPEAYENWKIIVQSVQSVMHTSGDRPQLFLAAIAPNLDIDPLAASLQHQGWHLKTSSGVIDNTASSLLFTQGIHRLGLIRSGFNDCIHIADGAIAMAGTATEQFVGLGKPVLIIPGHGPQFTPAFADAQTRLLGPSVTLVPHPNQVGHHIDEIFKDENQLQLIQKNGKRRMGPAGASERIAHTLTHQLMRNT